MSLSRFLRRPRAEREPRGQVLVIVAGGLLVMIAMTGLVVDGGFAWGQQRDNQNAADAASEAGAVVLAERLTGLARADADVLAAVNASVAANGVDKIGAWYTDIAGNLIDGAGAVVGSTADAAAVGNRPNGLIPPNAAGVQADTSKTFETFLVRAIGFDTLTAAADATAVAGYVERCEGDCNVLPVTVPVNVVTCAGNGEVVTSADPTSDPPGQPYEWAYYNVPLTIPLCKDNPGNVGWLDWTPTGGGTSELITAIGPPGTNESMTAPDWFYMTSTGNVNSSGVEDALNYYAISQTPVLIPMFDATCNTQPDAPSPEIPNDIARCPDANVGGSGQNQWYHVYRFVSFLFDGDPTLEGGQPGAFISGNNTPDCEENGNGATACLKGSFVRFVPAGVTVGPGTGNPGENETVGVQLIK